MNDNKPKKQLAKTRVVTAVLLVTVILGLIGFAVWWFVLRSDSQVERESTPEAATRELASIIENSDDQEERNAAINHQINIFEASGQYDKAANLADTVAKESNYFESYAYAGKMHALGGNIQTAVSSYEKALSLLESEEESTIKTEFTTEYQTELTRLRGIK